MESPSSRWYAHIDPPCVVWRGADNTWLAGRARARVTVNSLGKARVCHSVSAFMQRLIFASERVLERDRIDPKDLLNSFCFRQHFRRFIAVCMVFS